MPRSRLWVFPGQGSQYRGMGKPLFDMFPELVALADSVLGYSTRELCLVDPDRRLADTRYTQPALYLVNLLFYEKALREQTDRPDFFAGHSLGEYCALHASGAFDFETGLSLVQQRGALMAEAEGGGMAAVLNLPLSRLQELVARQGSDRIEIANYNSPSQVVLSGTLPELGTLQPEVESAGGSFIPLKVGAAFHSRLMRPTLERFAGVLASANIREVDLPVISNVHARPYRAGEVRSTLLEQLCRPVRWTATIEHALEQSGGELSFLELGPKDTLTKLIQEILALRQRQSTRTAATTR